MSVMPAVVAEGAPDRSNEVPDDYTQSSIVVSYDTAITSDSKLAESSSVTIRVKTFAYGDGTVKTLNLESEYLPVVVACENGAAPSESMKGKVEMTLHKHLWATRPVHLQNSPIIGVVWAKFRQMN